MSISRGREELSERSKNVLRVLIREYVKVGKPVGSSRLAEIYKKKLSSASLRKVMADLEREGYLAQPHTSSGRVPTSMGYRVYVGELLNLRNLPLRGVGQIKKDLAEEADPAELMSKTSEILSAYSNNIGIVMSPPIDRLEVRHIEFVRLDNAQKILVILVGTAGIIRQRVIPVSEKLSQMELDQAANYLVENFRGLSLSEMRERLLDLMSQERTAYDRLLKNVVLLGSAAVTNAAPEPEERREIYLGGASRVLERLESDEIVRLITFLQAIEEKSRLVRIITQCLSQAEQGPAVTIGLEEHIPGLRNWSLITSPFFFDPETSGSVGILGPSRMEYEQAISLVSYVAKLCGERLRSSN